MLRYILIRITWVFIVLITFLSLLFVVIRLVPEYPPMTDKEIEQYYAKQVTYGYMTSESVSDPEEIEKIKTGQVERCKRCFYYYSKGAGGDERYTIYKPVPILNQYKIWVKNIATDFDWGDSTSVRPNVPVTELLTSRLAVTTRINVMSLLVFLPLGLLLGVIAALKKNKLTDNIISLGVMVFISVPSFVIMLLLVLFLGFRLGWVPYRFGALDLTGPTQYTRYILPVFANSVGAIAGLTRLTRAELTEVLTSEFLLLARTKGLTRSQSVIRHALRNSLVPLIPSIIFSFVSIFTGSIIIENVYGIGGMGSIYVQSLDPSGFDYNLILALSAFYTTISLFAVLVVDLTYGIVDPRIRMGAKK